MIPFLDLKSINESFEPDLSRCVTEVVSSGWYLLGTKVQSFEREYKEYIGTSYCVGVGNGLDALRLIFRAYKELGVMQDGDEILVPANTYIASILAITDNNLVPVLIEPSIDNYNIDAALIEEKISSKTKGLMIVHLYGKNAMTDEIESLVNTYNLKLVEDNAQATGAVHKGKRTGSLGDAAGHSFYPGKNLGALGDAGAVTTNDKELADTVRAIANYGSKIKYVNSYQGWNSRLDELQAAVLSLKLKRLDSDNEKRRHVARLYCENITNPGITLPFEEFHQGVGMDHVWHLFVVRTEHREKVQETLSQNGIGSLVHYPIPPHRQDAYPSLRDVQLPVTEYIHERVVSLPMSPVMTDDDVMQVVEVLNEMPARFV